MHPSWHSWCGKPRGVDPARGGCPCPKTREERDTKAGEARRRHVQAVARAAGIPPDDPGGWLTVGRQTLLHLFRPQGLDSVCGQVSRHGQRTRSQGLRGRRCLACVGAAMGQGETR